jgi:hypothetical protein
MMTDGENNGVSKSTKAFGLSLALAGMVNALLVVAKEKSPMVMAGMQKLTGHHWITQAAAVMAVFVVCGFLFGRLNHGQGPKISVNGLCVMVVLGVVLSGTIIVGFYLVGDT